MVKLPISNYERPEGFRVNWGFGIERELLRFDQYGSDRGYYLDNEGIIKFDDEFFRNAQVDSRGIFGVNTASLYGPQIIGEISLGDITTEKLSTLMKIMGYQPGETPLECIRRQKDKTLLKPTQYIDLFFSGL